MDNEKDCIHRDDAGCCALMAHMAECYPVGCRCKEAERNRDWKWNNVRIRI